MRTRIAVLVAAALALVGALLSCNGPGAIYSTIETETKIPVSTLDQTITVQDIVNIATAATLPYFVAAGAVFNGSTPDANNNVGWPIVGDTPVPIAPPQVGAHCQALVQSPVDTSLFGGFYTDQSLLGLYQSTGSPPYTFDTTVAGTQQITGTGSPVSLAGKQIVLLQVAGGNLFVVAGSVPGGSSSYQYELDYSPAPQDNTSWHQVSGMSALPAPVTGVAWNGTNYFVTTAATTSPPTKSNLYIGSNLATGLAPSGTTAMTNDDLRGVTAVGTDVFIPGKVATVYYLAAGALPGTSFTSSDSVDGLPVDFLTVSQPVDTAGTPRIFLVGSRGNGFYYLNIGASNGTIGAGLSRYSDVTVTGLYAGAVRRILVDTARSNTVLMGTAGTGLWRGLFSTTTGVLTTTWVHE